MQISQKALVVISYYDRRPIDNLLELIRSILKYPAGGEFDICVVVNMTKEESLQLPAEYSWIPVLHRHNLGMNIGAWDHGWRRHPGYRDYLFLQDECYVIRDSWLEGYRAASERPGIGMVGESLNRAWDRSWDELRRVFGAVQMPDHWVDGKASNRIDCYLHFMRCYNVLCGQKGRHLRSVIWFFRGAVLDQIDGFLIGRNYGECIAAEIATSKKVESLGLGLAQPKDEEFFYIRHLEYNQDRPGAPYTHNAVYVNYSSVQIRLAARKRKRWQRIRGTLEKYLFLKAIR
jgi:hypothetical protein